MPPVYPQTEHTNTLFSGAATMRWFTAFLLLILLTACGGPPPLPASAEIPAGATVAPAETAPPTPEPLSRKLNGVWHAEDPPMQLTIDLDARLITMVQHGRKTDFTYAVEREAGTSVTLKNPTTGALVTVRFVNDDVVTWQTDAGVMTLTREQ